MTTWLSAKTTKLKYFRVAAFIAAAGPKWKGVTGMSIRAGEITYYD